MEEEIILTYSTIEEAAAIIDEHISLGHLFLRHDVRHNKITFKRTNYFPLLIKEEID